MAQTSWGIMNTIARSLSKDRSARLLLLILLGLLMAMALCGCDEKKPTPREVAEVPMYARLEPRDREWLLEHHNSRDGYLGWVMDELHLLDGGYRYWIAGDNVLQIENPANGKNLEVNIDRMWRTAGKKSGTMTASELLARARSDLGTSPPGSREQALVRSVVTDGERAQRLRFPELYKGLVVQETEQSLREIRRMVDVAQRNEPLRREVAKALRTLYAQRAMFLGVAHTSLRAPSDLHEYLTGETLRVAVQDGVTTVVAIPKAEAFAWPAGVVKTVGQDFSDVHQVDFRGDVTDSVDEAISSASSLWRQGNADDALEQARKALRLAEESHGAQSPEAARIRQMIEHARN